MKNRIEKKVDTYSGANATIKPELSQYGVDVCVSIICEFLHKSGFCHHKMILVAKQCIRGSFALDMSIYKPDMLDETGSDRRNALRRYGYGIHGKSAINKFFYYMVSIYQP